MGADKKCDLCSGSGKLRVCSSCDELETDCDCSNRSIGTVTCDECNGEGVVDEGDTCPGCDCLLDACECGDDEDDICDLCDEDPCVCDDEDEYDLDDLDDLDEDLDDA